MNREVKLAGHYVKRYWLWYVLGIVSLTAVDALVVYLPKITGQIVGGLEKNTIAMDQILRLLIRMVSIAALVALDASAGASSFSVRPEASSATCATTCSAILRRCPCAISTSTRPAT